MSNNNYNQPWLDIVTFLTKDLGMYLFSKTPSFETYRREIKNHIVTVKIKISDLVVGPELKLFISINGSNIWWHIQPYHSGYTIENLDNFNKIELVRIVIRNSIEFNDVWKSNADI